MGTKEISISISLKDRAGQKEACFQGFAYLPSGFLAGGIKPIGQTLSRAELVLLTAFTLTGCPIAARSNKELCNPWVLTGGAYKSHRRVTARHFDARAALTANTIGNQIAMQLNVAYEGVLPGLTSVAAPFQESITQFSRGILSGQFDVLFEDEDGTLHKAHATSEYQLALTIDVPPAWRNITILCFHEMHSLQQVEQIDMFGCVDEAEVDLRQKNTTIWATAARSQVARNRHERHVFYKNERGAIA